MVIHDEVSECCGTFFKKKNFFLATIFPTEVLPWYCDNTHDDMWQQRNHRPGFHLSIALL